MFPKVSSRWIEFIDKFCINSGISPAPWHLISLPLRSHVSKSLNTKDQVKLLQDHYKIIEEHFSPIIIKSLLEGKKFKLLNINGKSGNTYLFSFARKMRFRREGEITITLADKSDNAQLATITFTFGKDHNGNNFMLIGGLQGTQSEFGKEKIVKVTRDLHGLRPKYAVLECAYTIASFFGITSIIATSIANHPTKHTNKKSMKNFFADYNLFWQEIGGTLNKDGNFQLPLILPKRELSEVPSKKRKDWLKRHEYLGLINSYPLNTLNALQRIKNY